MNRADVGRLLAVYGLALIGGTLLWILLFHGPLFADWVFFYRGIALLVTTVGVVVLALALYRRAGNHRGLIGIRDILLIGTLLLSVNVVFFTHLPVTADRSLTVFMLAYLDRSGGALTEIQISDEVVAEYVEERAAIHKRLAEQLATGTLAQVGDGYAISDEGRSLVRLYDAVASLFNLSPANLRP